MLEDKAGERRAGPLGLHAGRGRAPGPGGRLVLPGTGAGAASELAEAAQSAVRAAGVLSKSPEHRARNKARPRSTKPRRGFEVYGEDFLEVLPPLAHRAEKGAPSAGRRRGRFLRGNVRPGTRSKWAPQALGLGLHHEPARVWLPRSAAGRSRPGPPTLQNSLRGPISPEVVPAGQVLLGKEEEAAAFQNLVGWGAEVGQDVKAQRVFFLSPCLRRRKGSAGARVDKGFNPPLPLDPKIRTGVGLGCRTRPRSSLMLAGGWGWGGGRSRKPRRGSPGLQGAPDQDFSRSLSV